ncbi:TadE family protein [Amycolatopsis nigrescens]|uniref:TadE family protein n=1 Tax=Amycolatopsis nigrescens TaxID=381445 RepID=UPI0003735266|nr:TadE family protein [Amycolatopsis nigrescens]
MGRHPVSAERGAVTVEAAIALTAMVLVFGAILGGVAAVTGQLRCVDAAREAARMVARGQPGLAAQVVAEIAPHGARLDVRQEGETVTVRVLADRAGIGLEANAYAMLEPGVGASGAPP